MNKVIQETRSTLIPFALIALVALTGCATKFEPKPLPPNHPASVQGEEAPRSGMKRLIATDQLSRTSKAQLARTEVPNPDFQPGGMSHDMANMPGMDMSKPATGSPPAQPQTMPGMDASQMKNMTPNPGNSPVNKEPGNSAKSSPTATIYTCVMHPEVQQSAPGKCPKCGMTLVKKEPATP